MIYLYRQNKLQIYQGQENIWVIDFKVYQELGRNVMRGDSSTTTTLTATTTTTKTTTTDDVIRENVCRYSSASHKHGVYHTMSPTGKHQSLEDTICTKCTVNGKRISVKLNCPQTGTVKQTLWNFTMLRFQKA